MLPSRNGGNRLANYRDANNRYFNQGCLCDLSNRNREVVRESDKLLAQQTKLLNIYQFDLRAIYPDDLFVVEPTEHPAHGFHGEPKKI